MKGRSIIVIGASAGGVEALQVLVKGLPYGLNAAIFIVLHIGSSPSQLAAILARVSALPVSQAIDGEEILAGHIYVAAPDRHLVLTRGHMRLLWGPKENYTRPAIDPLFRSAAKIYGEQVVGVVLTGRMDDGSAGLLAIKDEGGIAIVQDPKEAFAASMPESAIATGEIDHVCLLADIGPLIARYDPPDGIRCRPAPEPTMIQQDRMSEERAAGSTELSKIGIPSPFTCPECGGVLHQLQDHRLLRFRCASGHAMSGQALRVHLAEVREQVLWHAIELFDQEIALSRLLDSDGAKEGEPAMTRAMETLRQLLQSSTGSRET